MSRSHLAKIDVAWAQPGCHEPRFEGLVDWGLNPHSIHYRIHVDERCDLTCDLVMSLNPSIHGVSISVRIAGLVTKRFKTLPLNMCHE